MLTGANVPILLGQSEIDQEQFIAVPADAHQEIVGFDVSVNERFAMHVFDSADHLIGQHENGFDGEATRTKIEEIFQRRPQQIHDKHVVIFFLSIVSENYRFCLS